MFRSLRTSRQTFFLLNNLRETIRSFVPVTHGAKVCERRTVSAEDVNIFAKLTGDFNSIHFGKVPIAHGVLINGYVSALLGTRLPGPGYAVVEQRMSFPNPCYVGDEIEISVEVAEIRKIVTCKYVCSVPHRECIVHEGIAKLVKMKTVAR